LRPGRPLRARPPGHGDGLHPVRGALRLPAGAEAPPARARPGGTRPVRHGHPQHPVRVRAPPAVAGRARPRRRLAPLRLLARPRGVLRPALTRPGPVPRVFGFTSFHTGLLVTGRRPGRGGRLLDGGAPPPTRRCSRAATGASAPPAAACP